MEVIINDVCISWWFFYCFFKVKKLISFSFKSKSMWCIRFIVVVNYLIICVRYGRVDWVFIESWVIVLMICDGNFWVYV